MIIYNKKPKDYKAKHIKDNIDGLGYDYHKNVFRKSMSPGVFANPKTAKMINKIEEMFDYLIDAVKLISVHYSIAHDKDSININ